MQRKAHKAQQGKGKPGRLSCQADGCQERLTKCKAYCARYRVCPTHLIAQWVPVQGVASRFCQQCAKFHVVEAFDGRKRSCRIQLARHNDSRKQRRKEAAVQQHVNRTVATPQHPSPHRKAKQQHADSSTEDNCVPASGSSCSSQRPPSAASTASEDDSLSALLIMLQNQQQQQQQPQLGPGSAAKHQQMTSKARGTCNWQQQQQRSGSSDMDCCHDLQQDHGHPAEIGPDDGNVAAVAAARLHTLQSSREPSPELCRADRPPTAAAAAAAHSGESSPGAWNHSDPAGAAAVGAAAAYAVNNSTALHGQPTHAAAAAPAAVAAQRLKRYTPFAAVGAGTQSTYTQGRLPETAVQQQQQHGQVPRDSLSQHNWSPDPTMAASGLHSDPHALQPVESTGPADAHDNAAAAAAAAESLVSPVSSDGQQHQLGEIPLPFGSPMPVPVLEPEDVGRIPASTRKDGNRVQVPEPPCPPCPPAAAAQGPTPPALAAAALENGSVAAAASGLRSQIQRQQAAGSIAKQPVPFGALCKLVDLDMDRLAALVQGCPLTKRTSKKRSTRSSTDGGDPVLSTAAAACARPPPPAAAAAAAAAVNLGQPAGAFETVAAAAGAAAAHHVLSKEAVAGPRPHRVGCSSCTFPRCPQCADTATATAESRMSTLQQQQQPNGEAQGAGNSIPTAAVAAAEACQQYPCTVEADHTCIEASGLLAAAAAAAVAGGGGGGTNGATMSTVHPLWLQQQPHQQQKQKQKQKQQKLQQQQGGHSSSMAQNSRAAQVPAYLPVAPLNASNFAAAAAAAAEGVHASNAPQPADEVAFGAPGKAVKPLQFATAATAAEKATAAPLQAFGSIQWCHQADQQQQQQQPDQQQPDHQQQQAKRRSLPPQLPPRQPRKQQQQQQHAVVSEASTQVQALHQQQQQQQHQRQEEQEADHCAQQRPLLSQHLKSTIHAERQQQQPQEAPMQDPAAPALLPQQQQQQSLGHQVPPSGQQQISLPIGCSRKLALVPDAGLMSSTPPIPQPGASNRVATNQIATAAIAATAATAATAAQTSMECAEYEATSYDPFSLPTHTSGSSGMNHSSSSSSSFGGSRGYEVEEPPAAATEADTANAAAVRGSYACTVHAPPGSFVTVSMRTPFAAGSTAYGATAHQLTHHQYQQRQQAVQPSNKFANQIFALEDREWQLQQQQYPPHVQAHTTLQQRGRDPQPNLQPQQQQQQPGFAAAAQYAAYPRPASPTPVQSAVFPQQQLMLQGCTAQGFSHRPRSLSPRRSIPQCSGPRAQASSPQGLSHGGQGLSPRSLSPHRFSPRGQGLRPRSCSPPAYSPRGQGSSPRRLSPERLGPRGQGLRPRSSSPHGFSPRGQGASPGSLVASRSMQGFSPRRHWFSPRAQGSSPRGQGLSPRYYNGSGYPARGFDLDCTDLYQDWTQDAPCYDDMMLDEILAPIITAMDV